MSAPPPTDKAAGVAHATPAAFTYAADDFLGLACAAREALGDVLGQGQLGDRVDDHQTTHDAREAHPTSMPVPTMASAATAA